ncbi:hypothetical protein Tco_1417856 [Tanacetum coccineum]
MVNLKQQERTISIRDKSEEEKVQETEFGVPSGEKVNKSEDPFGIYSLLQKNKTNMENKVNEEDHSYSHPHSGFTPEVDHSKLIYGDIAEKTLIRINHVQKNQASEISQKAKIKWAIEGDENVKFFHGILNKKRSQSQIRGVMANGVWIDDPVKVKDEFLMHFRSRFDKPLLNRVLLDLKFTNSLTKRQKEDPEQRYN